MCDNKNYKDLLSKEVIYGVDKENDLLQTIKNKFGNDIIKIENKFSIYDFGNDDILIELKSRKCKKCSFNTTMIGQNKIDYLYKQYDMYNKTCYCMFNFSDGLYYININKETVKQFNMNQSGGRNDRGRNEIKNKGYCYIPIKLLLPV